jgi:hypothetical protein
VNFSHIPKLEILGCDSTAGVSTLEKLQPLAVAHEATVGHGDQDPAPLSSCQCVSTTAPHVQPSDNEGVPMKSIQIGADAAQTTRMTGDLGDK